MRGGAARHWRTRSERDDEPREAAAARSAAARSGGDARFDGVSTDTRTLAHGRSVRRAARRALRRPRLPRRRRRRRRARGAMVDRRHAGAPPLPRDRRRRHARSRSARWRAHWRARFAPAADRDHRLERQDHGQGDARRDPAPRTPATTRVLATRGNLNNDIGVPLTLLRAAREPPLLRDRARHEPSGRDRLPRRHRAARRGAGQQRAARAPRVHAVGRRGRGARTRACSTRCPPTASR